MNPQEKSDAADDKMEKAVALLHQVRNIGAAALIAFIVLGSLATITFIRYRDSTVDFTNINRVTICDLYERIDARQPAALHCTKARP